MTSPNALKFTRALEARGPARRSALYRWLYANHATVSLSLDRSDRSWVEAAELVAVEGLVGANGKPISPKALRQMWLRVARDVERAREAEAAAPKRPQPHRSRPGGSWRPPVVIAPAPMAKSSDDWMPRLPTTDASALAGDQRQSADADTRETMARLQRTLRERSGH